MLRYRAIGLAMGHSERLCDWMEGKPLTIIRSAGTAGRQGEPCRQLAAAYAALKVH